ncbi:hypothetical protein J4526_00380 [Desulfurococcaceae archaeon MEX13E-LK6-19]|nr:hypothetical protein J4526_00380 [Desulfurococcaceae archaeon MEX13E-LK6-19]
MVLVDPKRGFVCKKCGKSMGLIAESEKLSDNSLRIKYYYKCPSCGYRIDAEQLTIGREQEFILVKRKVFLLTQTVSV